MPIRPHLQPCSHNISIKGFHVIQIYFKRNEDNSIEFTTNGIIALGGYTESKEIDSIEEAFTTIDDKLYFTTELTEPQLAQLSTARFLKEVEEFLITPRFETAYMPCANQTITIPNIKPAGYEVGAGKQGFSWFTTLVCKTPDENHLPFSILDDSHYVKKYCSIDLTWDGADAVLAITLTDPFSGGSPQDGVLDPAKWGMKITGLFELYKLPTL